jgi:hypothetical protein
MTTTDEEVAAALDALPEQMRDPTTAYLVEQAKKFRILEDRAAEGGADAPAGGASETKFTDFLSQGRPKCADRLEMQLRSRGASRR